MTSFILAVEITVGTPDIATIAYWQVLWRPQHVCHVLSVSGDDP